MKPDENNAASREAEYLAATSEQLKEIDITHGYQLVPGRPHLNVGPIVLSQLPTSLVITFIHCALSVVLAYMLLLFLEQPRGLHLVHWTPFFEWAKPFFWPALIAGLFLTNVGWAAMAAEIAGKPLHPRMLLAGFMGWLPMPAVKELVLPPWMHDKITGGLKETLWGGARLAQIHMAFWLGAGYSKQQTDLALARAFHKNGEQITDSVSSYVMYPIVAVMIMIGLFALVVSLPQAGDTGLYLFGYLVLAYVAWWSFNRSALFAMTFQFMAEEADEPPHQVDWACRKLNGWYWLGSSLYLIGFVLFLLYIFFAPH